MKLRRVLYVQYTDPAAYPPLEHSSNLLAERGWDVVFLGTGTKLDHTYQLPSHPHIRVRAIRLFKEGWKQKLHYVVFFLWTFWWVISWRPNWIYASDPLSAPGIWVIRKLTNIAVLYHEHDSPNPTRSQSWFMRLAFEYRKKLGREAEACVIPQRDRLLQFLRETRRVHPTFCVWNCPRLDEVREIRSNPKGDMIVYYHGSITSARVPAELIVAACRFKGAIRLRIAGYEPQGSVGYVRELKRLASENGVDLIEFVGTIPLREDLLRSAAEAHVGLSLMPKGTSDINLQHMVGASNKPFDYMACGLPLLVTDLPDWVSNFVRPGYARGCEPCDPDSIETELRWYLEHPLDRLEMGRRCKDKIRQSWNYETAFADVVTFMETGKKSQMLG
jgi:glycosyltransferase involved in cell wall biosynthesis